MSLDLDRYRQALNPERLDRAGGLGPEEGNALLDEVIRLRALVKLAERRCDGPSGYDCPWCLGGHAPDCPAFTPEGEVR